MIGLITGLVMLPVISCSRSSSYKDFTANLNRLESEGKYDSADYYIGVNYDRFVDHEFELLKEKVYVNSQRGQYKKNLDVFRYGHERGYFFLLHPAIPAYEPYIGLEGFDEIVARDMELRRSANESSEPEYQVILPHRYNKKKAYPMVYIFHGGGSNNTRAISEWTSDILDNNFIRVFIQSPVHADFDTFGWRNSDTLAVSFIEKLYSDLRMLYRIDTSSVFFGGVSAGGTVAVFSAFRSKIPVAGYIGVCTGIPLDLKIDDYSARNNIRALMISGENDYYKPRQDSLRQIYRSINLECRYMVLPGMGHQYPDNFSSLLDENIPFIYAGKNFHQTGKTVR